jgi:hypothetical protein
MDKSTISMAIFNSKLLVYQRVLEGTQGKKHLSTTSKIPGVASGITPESLSLVVSMPMKKGPFLLINGSISPNETQHNNTDSKPPTSGQ